MLEFGFPCTREFVAAGPVSVAASSTSSQTDRVAVATHRFFRPEPSMTGCRLRNTVKINIRYQLFPFQVNFQSKHPSPEFTDG